MRGGEGEMLYCITNRLNKGLISVDRNKRMLLYYLQYPVPTFKSSAKDLSHPIFGIVFQRATDTACFAAPARLKFMALEKHEGGNPLLPHGISKITLKVVVFHRRLAPPTYSTPPE